MKLKINKEENSCIRKDLEIELGNYTILAGENNSGKSSLARAIYNHKDLKEYKKIFIPAEHIQPQNEETKNSAAKTDFYKLLKSILNPLFDKKILEGLISNFNKSPEKKRFINGVNSILKEFGINEKEFDVKISDDELEEDFIIKMTRAFVRDLYKTDINEVDFNNIGMGTQRLIVAALIRYYEEQKVEADEKICVIFEEPEIYLHPNWKKALYKSLNNLSNRKNTIVLITTHDPYFIEMNMYQTIYKVFRNSKDSDATDIKLVEDDVGKLGYKSDGEVNYLIFGIPSESYFLELYEYVKDNSKKNRKDFESYLFSKISDQTQYDRDNQEPWKLTYVSRLRHNLAHPKDTKKMKYDLSLKVEDAIIDLIKLA